MVKLQKIVYFDVTDVIHFAESNDRVTGIQRVQLRLISDLVAKYGAEYVRGVAYLGRQGGWQEIRLDRVLNQPEFNAIDFLVAVGRIKPSFFPPAAQVKRAVAKFNDRKILRALKKFQIYAKAVISRSTLRDEGFRFYYKEDCPPVANLAIDQLPRNAVYALLGVSLSNDKVEKFARSHHASGGVVAQMMYDLIPYTHPQLHDARLSNNFNSWLVRTHKHVSVYLCISQSTAKDLKHFLSLQGAEADIAVTPLPHEFLGFDRGQVAALPLAASRQLAALAKQDFVLCVGSIEVRKNGLNLLKAWAQVHAVLKEKTPKLVFAGRLGWKIEDFKKYLIDSNFIAETVQIVESPSDEDLAWLYSHCKFTVYPSLYEGWGLPVGEGAWFNKYCISSSTSSMPEVCGNLIDYVEPNDVDDLAQKIIRPLQDDVFLANRSVGMAAATLRTWKDVAEDVFAHLQLCASHSNAK
jgi:glycosyltransferase involved in cell wall biosynthesis